MVRHQGLGRFEPGCHDSRAKALKQQRALYANEPTMTAAVAPLKPPREWFDTPEADGPHRMTYADDGQVYGHLAAWGTCHVGFQGGAFTECVQPRAPRPTTRSSISGSCKQTREHVPVGKITYATGHAPMSADLEGAHGTMTTPETSAPTSEHRNGRHGIWVAGALRSDLRAEHLRDLRANPPSGDWRLYASSLELVAALAVPVPGFPIPPHNWPSPPAER